MHDTNTNEPGAHRPIFCANEIAYNDIDNFVEVNYHPIGDQVEVVCAMTLDWDFTVTPQVFVPASDFIRGLALARQGRPVEIVGREADSCLTMRSNGFYLKGPDRGYIGEVATASTVPNFGFDAVFLDTFSVIENSEPRMRTDRDVQLSIVENALLSIAANRPELIHNFSPREFETFVASLLLKLGFSKVRLSRYVKDGGYDIYAVHCDADKEYTVLVEVKHYARRRVGLEIVDRLNGVRDFTGADKGMVVTTSQFSNEACKRAYGYNCNKIALIDFQRIIELLQACEYQWKETPSGLWHLKRKGHSLRNEAP